MSSAAFPSVPIPSVRRVDAAGVPRAVRAWSAVGLAMLVGAGCEVRDEVGLATRPRMRVARVAAMLERAAAVRPRIAGTAEPRPATVDLVEGYEAGVRLARAESRPLLLVFKANWCRHSGLLVQRTLLDARVVALSRRYVCAAVDADREADVCRRFGVDAFPTMIVVDRQGRTRRESVGRPSITALVAMLDDGGPNGTPARVAEGTVETVR